MGPKHDRPATKSAWIDRARAAVSVLKTLMPEEFFDTVNNSRRPVYNEIAILAWSLPVDPSGFDRFIAAYPQRSGWLPEEPEAMDALTDEEILFRLKKNVADGRWVDGSLVEPFRSGTLVAAMERLINGIDGFEIGRD